MSNQGKARYALLAMLGATSFPVQAQPIPGPTVANLGERIEIAAAKAGIDWRFDRKECGGPKYDDGVCVWLSGGPSVVQARFSLVTQDAGPVTVRTATLHWTHRQDRRPGEEKTFRDLCLAFVAAVLPEAPESKAREVAGKLLGNLRGSGELSVDHLQFYRNASADGISCEAIPKFD